MSVTSQSKVDHQGELRMSGLFLKRKYNKVSSRWKTRGANKELLFCQIGNNNHYKIILCPRQHLIKNIFISSRQSFTEHCTMNVSFLFFDGVWKCLEGISGVSS